MLKKASLTEKFQKCNVKFIFYIVTSFQSVAY
jgi:hypothetical protein